MKANPDLEHIRSMVRSVADSCIVVVQRVSELAEQLEAHGGGGQSLQSLQNLLGSPAIDSESLFAQVIIDPAAKTVTYRGCTCCLGNTLVFRLIERLARRPNHFVSFDRLIRDVWEGHPKSDEAIRSLMKELRDRLRRKGMRRLASAFRGEKRAYALMLKS